jgi:exodeoxyribonuclease V alpha subunit
LRDLIASERVGVVRLEEIFRQAGESRIVSNAHGILRGQAPETTSPEQPGADFFIIHRRDGADAARVIEELVSVRIPKRFGLDPLQDIQVLTPMHRGPVGTIALNELLQSRLNQSDVVIERRGQRFGAGDKVMQTKNDYDRDVFNGDVGRVESVDRQAKTLTVRFDGRRVTYDEPALDTLTLAYATSIHKSQGSEYPAVVIPMLTSHFVMLSRNLLYTAVTRAKRLCCLVADPRALSLALGETRREDRLTRLASRL